MSTVRPPLRTSTLLSLTLSFGLAASACSSDSLDDNGKPTLGPTDYEEPNGKADALQGRRGPSASWDNRSTQVWPVTNQWADRETSAARASGIAWDADSGMSWEEKYHAWVGSMEREDRTFKFMTPFGKEMGSPALECAEQAMFFRIAFASWYELPFFIEAFDNGKRVYFGHMGIVDSSGNRWNGMPRFKNNYKDHSNMADQVRANPELWPSDAKLRQRSIIGTSSDAQPAVDAEHAGALFDEIFLNKRVGYFLAKQLGFNGSIHLADSANSYNLRADAFEPGDYLVKRTAPTGTGHTVVVTRVKELGTIEFEFETYKTREAEVISGNMPRRQGLWEGPSSSKRFYFLSSSFGGESSVDHGAGLKRFRAPRVIGGKWSNTVLPEDADRYISSNAREKLLKRQDIYKEILLERTFDEREAEIVQNLEFQRDHLRMFPSSCSARSRREKAFEGLYELGLERGRSRETVDREHRLLEDYIFAELEYEESKTCCWNSSTAEMYEMVVRYNQCLLGEIDDVAACVGVDVAGQCSDVRVFRAHANDGDGFETFRAYAEAQGVDFVNWSPDESCPQAGVAEDTLKDEQPSELCSIFDDIR